MALPDAVRTPRAAAALVVAVVAPALGLACLPSVAGLGARWAELRPVEGQTAGIAGVALALGLLLATPAVLLPRRSAAVTALAVGGIAAVFSGVASSRGLGSTEQISLTLMTGVPAAVGLLVGTALLVASRGNRLDAGCAGVSLVVTALTLAWRGTGDAAPVAPAETVTLPGVLAGGLVVTVWCVSDLTTDPPAAQPPARPKGAVTGAALGAVGSVVAGLILTGYATGITAAWLRPAILVAGALAAVCLMAAVVSWRRPVDQVATGSTVLACVFLPGVTGLLLPAYDSSAAHALLVAAGAAAALVGGVLGVRTPDPACTLAPRVVALGACLVWPLQHVGWTLPGVTLLIGGLAAQLAAGLAHPRTSDPAVTGTLGVAGLLVGTMTAVPASWALGGGLAVDADLAGSGLRVALGLLAAAEVMAAALVYVVRRRGDDVRPGDAPQRDLHPTPAG